MPYVNPRVKRTRKKLADGLIHFVLEHGYEKLGVNALCRYAGVGHTTFYRHYRDMDDLILSELQDAIDHLIRETNQHSQLFDALVVWWAFVEAHPKFFRFYVHLPHEHPGRQLCFDAAAQFMHQRLALGNPERVPTHIASNHIVESLYKFLLLYLEDMDAYTPEQMATFYLDLIIQPEGSKVIELRQSDDPAPGH